jgi:hypothetical protein
MMGKGQRCAAPIGFEAAKGNVIATAYDVESKYGQRAQYPLQRRIDWKFGHALFGCGS